MSDTSQTAQRETGSSDGEEGSASTRSSWSSSPESSPASETASNRAEQESPPLSPTDSVDGEASMTNGESHLSPNSYVLDHFERSEGPWSRFSPRTSTTDLYAGNSPTSQEENNRSADTDDHETEEHGGPRAQATVDAQGEQDRPQEGEDSRPGESGPA